MTEVRAVRLARAALREAGLPEAEGGTMPGIPVTRAGWHVTQAAGEARVTHWGVTILTEAEKRAVLEDYVPVLQAAGLAVSRARRGAFLTVPGPGTGGR